MANEETGPQEGQRDVGREDLKHLKVPGDDPFNFEDTKIGKCAYCRTHELVSRSNASAASSMLGDPQIEQLLARALCRDISYEEAYRTAFWILAVRVEKMDTRPAHDVSRTAALFEVLLDSMGAMSNTSEIDASALGISPEEAKEIRKWIQDRNAR